jgi:NAD(P)H dehydrogenase (quinone)
MRAFILYANPVDTSFGSALHERAVAALRSGSHFVDDCDLYEEAFDPVLSRQERLGYHDTRVNRSKVVAWTDRLLAADALVLIYPVWNEGFPAILKGFFDRVFIPGVSLCLAPDGSAVPNLTNLKKLAAIATYGASRLNTLVLGDPPRRVVKRLVRAMPGHRVTCDYLALYDMNHSTMDRRAAFLRRVEQVFRAW